MLQTTLTNVQSLAVWRGLRLIIMGFSVSLLPDLYRYPVSRIEVPAEAYPLIVYISRELHLLQQYVTC